MCVCAICEMIAQHNRHASPFITISNLHTLCVSHTVLGRTRQHGVGECVGCVGRGREGGCGARYPWPHSNSHHTRTHRDIAASVLPPSISHPMRRKRGRRMDGAMHQSTLVPMTCSSVFQSPCLTCGALSSTAVSAFSLSGTCTRMSVPTTETCNTVRTSIATHTPTATTEPIICGWFTERWRVRP